MTTEQKPEPKFKGAQDFTDNYFLVSTYDEHNAHSKIVKGWDEIIDMCVAAHYGDKASPAKRALVIRDLSNWQQWTKDSQGVPFNKIQPNDAGGGVDIIRIVDFGDLKLPDGNNAA